MPLIPRLSRRTMAVAFAFALVCGASASAAYASAPSNSELIAPALHQRVVFVGSTVHGRRLETTCAGDGPQLVLLVGGMHTGGEAITVTLAEEVAQAMHTGGLIVPSHARLCVLPMLNADGIVYGTRTNANLVDLNRNWPAPNWRPDAYHASEAVSGGVTPLSEPETMSLWAYVTAARPAAVIVLHCCGGLVEPNDSAGAPALAQAYAYGSGLVYTHDWTMYPITGQLIDAMDTFGLAAIDVEITDSADTAFGNHRAGIEAVLHQLALPTS